MIVDLTKEQIENLISMLENSQFKGKDYEKVGDLLKRLKKGLVNEPNNTNSSD